MGNKLMGTATIQTQVAGDMALYLDAGCTQPVLGLTAIDFGSFPPNGGSSSKRAVVFCRNECNYPATVTINSNYPLVVVDATFPLNPNFLQGTTVMASNSVVKIDVGAILTGLPENVTEPVNFVFTARRFGVALG